MSTAGELSTEVNAREAGGERERRTGLTEYEAKQVQAIAAWKAQPPNPFGELFKRITQPVANRIERALPDALMKKVIDQAYTIADRAAAAGSLPTDRTLEESGAEAIRVGAAACTIALAEGAVTGAGGVVTTLVDIPLLFVLALGTILKIGRCHGYPLDRERDRKYVLGVLIAAISGSLDTRLERLGQLHDIEDWFLAETQQEILTEEAAALLFQLELFEGLPAIGALSGGLLNLAFMKRVDRTALHVFQERWLRDRGKLGAIAPSETHSRARARGWTGAFQRATYAGCYGVGYAVALPIWLVGALVRPPARVPRPVSA